MKKNLNLFMNLSEEEKNKMKEEIVAFYMDVRGEEIGIIEKEQMMDLFLEQLAPIIYNKALDDIGKWYKNQQDNLESDFYSLYKEIR